VQVLVEGLLLPNTARKRGNGKQAELNVEQGGKTAGRRGDEGPRTWRGAGWDRSLETYGPDYS